MKIRKIKPDELDAVASIEAACFPPEEAASPKQIKERYRVFPECFWGAEDEEGRLVGFVDGCMTDRPTLPDSFYADPACHQKDGAWQTVFGLNVLPEYRHQKIATHLMMEMISESDRRGKKGVVLTCKDHMMPFYDSLGFRWRGVSASTHGGAKWNDMLLVFHEEDLPPLE
ncbi:MAG: GNAT family N-acetyltransferase [Lachnospiraceae bacterium]|jgi:predicted N-acetyltransferase YhbS|nr:GNAT family N-acetyltransferase [Lachnospiraceae bacterium]